MGRPGMRSSIFRADDPGQSQDIDGGRTAAQQRRGAFAGRGTGGEHIIHQQNALTSDAGPVLRRDKKSAADVSRTIARD